MSYEDLIARLEKATGPDRELDALIECALGAPTYARADLVKGWHWEFEADDKPGCVSAFAVLGNKTSHRQRRFDAPLYTASLDAALTLVPEGQSAQTTRYANHEGGAWVGDEDFVRAATPAIALCIAALKARQSISSAQDK